MLWGCLLWVPLRFPSGYLAGPSRRGATARRWHWAVGIGSVYGMLYVSLFDSGACSNEALVLLGHRGLERDRRRGDRERERERARESQRST